MMHETHSESMVSQFSGIWRRRKWWFILTFFPLVAGAFALIVSLPPLYRASTTILVGYSDILDTLVVSDQRGGLEQGMAVARQELLSRSHLQELVNKHDLYPEMQETAPPQAIMDRVRSDILIERGSTSSRLQQQTAYPITISYRSWDPELAAAVANDLASSYAQKNAALRVRQATGTTTFLRQQLEASRMRLEENEAMLNAFKRQHLGELPEQQGINLATLERLNAELRLNGEKQVQLLDRYNNLLSGGDAGGTPGGLPRLVLLRQELVELRSRYTNQHPEVNRVRNEIAALEAVQDELSQGAQDNTRLRTLQGTLPDTERQLEELQRRENELNQRIDELEIRLETMPALEQELGQLARNHDIVRAEYARYQEQYRNASTIQSLENRQDKQFTVLETALPPEFPVEPGSMGLLMMSCIMAMACSGGLVIMREQFDTSFHSIREVHDYTRLPILSSVAVISTPWDKMRRSIRYSIGGVLFVICLVAMVVLFHFLGDHLGKQLVWLIAGRSA